MCQTAVSERVVSKLAERTAVWLDYLRCARWIRRHWHLAARLIQWPAIHLAYLPCSTFRAPLSFSRYGPICQGVAGLC